MADLKVNDRDWGLLTNQDKTEMKQILVECGLLQSVDRILGDPTIPGMTDPQFLPYLMRPQKHFLCKSICVAAQVEGMVDWAAKFSEDPVARAICMAVMALAVEECKKKCEAMFGTVSTT